MSFISRLFRGDSSPQAIAPINISVIHSYDAEFIYFRLAGDTSMAMAEEWLFDPNDCMGALAENTRIILAQFAEQGIVHCVGDVARIHNEDFYTVPKEDRDALGLAEYYRMGIQIRAKGILHEKTFRYEYDYVDGSGRAILGMRRVGAFLEYGLEKKYLLSAEQYFLLKELDEFNAKGLAEKSYQQNLLRFADIKGFASQVGAELDRYLGKENVVAVNEVGIDVQFIDHDTIQINPVAAGVEQEKMTATVQRFNTVQPVYDLPAENQGRVRLVLSEKAMQGITEVKKVSRLTGNAKADFLKRPQDFLDPEVISVEDYSDRVLEIGQYNPHAFTFINNEKTAWLPDLEITPEDFDLLPKDLESEEENQDAIGEEGNSTLEDGESNDDSSNILLIKRNIDDLDYSSQAVDYDYAAGEVEMPTDFAVGTMMLDHQKRGLGWLQEIYTKRLAGGLLADDMGLGKTLQVLAFISWQRKQELQYPTLIVAPVALLENWQEEYEKFFVSNTKILKLHGDTLSSLRRVRQWSGAEYKGEPRVLLDTAAIEKFDLVFTTYETVRDYQFSLGKINWSTVVTDESQKIKNPTTLVTSAAKALKAKFHIACTATPVENSLVDLWCIMDFSKPGHLGSLKEYMAQFVHPLKEQDVERQPLVKQLRDKMHPCFLRRMKKDILLDLPEKLHHTREIKLTALQLQQYIGVVNGYQSISEKNRQGLMLKVLQQLRNISAYPDCNDDYSALNIDKAKEQSSKVKVLLEILLEIQQKGEKVIIFTEQRRIQRILAQIIYKQFSISPGIVNGEVSGSASGSSSKPTRKRMVDEFQRKLGFNVIIMSPQAAGFGLNIVEANHVVHFTRLWNPAKEDQATDRVYRIGQVKPVHVYHFIAVDPEGRFISFDQRLNELLDRKRALATDFLCPSENSESKLEEFRDVLDIGHENIKQSITIDDIVSLTPRLFQMAITLLYDAEGYNSSFTSSSADYGVDIVCTPRNPSEKSIIIKCVDLNQTSIDRQFVDSLTNACSYYEKKYQMRFTIVVVMPRDFEKKMLLALPSNGIHWVGRSELDNMLNQHVLFLHSIYERDVERERYH